MNSNRNYKSEIALKTLACAVFLAVGGTAATAQIMQLDKRDNRVKVEVKSDWLPAAAEISHVESLLKMPRRVGKLQDYDRYWAGKFEKGRKQIYGYFISTRSLDRAHPPPGRTIITRYSLVGPLWDAGCGTIDVTYDVQEDRILEHICGGTLGGPAGPHGWRYRNSPP